MEKPLESPNPSEETWVPGLSTTEQIPTKGKLHFKFVGDEEFKIYSEKRISEHDDNPEISSAIGQLSCIDGVVTNVNVYNAAFMNCRVLIPNRMHCASPAEIEQILLQEPTMLNNIQVDSAIIVKSINDGVKNPHYIIKQLQKRIGVQLDDMYKTKFFKTPQMIPLSDLAITRRKEDNRLITVLRMRTSAHPIYADKLRSEFINRKFSLVDAEGLPNYSDEGQRTLYWKGTNGPLDNLTERPLWRLFHEADKDGIVNLHTTHALSLTSPTTRMIAVWYE